MVRDETTFDPGRGLTFDLGGSFLGLHAFLTVLSNDILWEHDLGFWAGDEEVVRGRGST